MWLRGPAAWTASRRLDLFAGGILELLGETIETTPTSMITGIQSREAFARRLRRRATWILALGLSAAVIPLLILVTVEFASTDALRDVVARLAEVQNHTVDALERTRRAQTAVRFTVYRQTLSPDAQGRAEAVRLVEAYQREIRTAALAVADVDHLAEEWDSFIRANDAFLSEARRLLDEPATDMDRLFALQDRSMASLRRLVDASHAELQRVTLRLDAGLRRLPVLALYGSLLCLLAVAAAVAVTTRMVRGTLQQFDGYATELQSLSAALIAKQEEAARRFSHELHDELGQTLVAARAGVASLQPAPGSEGDREATLELLDEAITSVRDLSHLMHPTLLEHFGLAGALQSLTETFGQRTGIEAVCRIGFDGRLSHDVRAHLYRIAQEALTNVAKHSGADRVEVSLTRSGPDVVLEISDNGKGLSDVSTSDGIGLRGMQARAAFAGGEFEVAAGEGRGATIRVRVPAKGVDGGDESTDQDPGRR